MTDLNDPDLDPTEAIQVALYRRSKVCDDAAERRLMGDIADALDDRPDDDPVGPCDTADDLCEDRGRAGDRLRAYLATFPWWKTGHAARGVS